MEFNCLDKRYQATILERDGNTYIAQSGESKFRIRIERYFGRDRYLTYAEGTVELMEGDQSASVPYKSAIVIKTRSNKGYVVVIILALIINAVFRK